MLDFLMPVLAAVFIWWFTTGLIMAVYRRSRSVMALFFLAATLVTVLAYGGIYATRDTNTITGVYVAATCGIIIWGWQVAGYYLGFVTGPMPIIPESSSPRTLRERFRLALRYSLHHEIITALSGVLIAVLTWSHSNRWGLWIYLTLWLMHTSAKLNVFLGVRNFHIEILPPRMHHLNHLLSSRTINALFPFSVVIASSMVLGLIYQGIAPGTDPAQTTGTFVIATMITLGILEHWMLVLPLPAIIWGWGLRSVSLDQSGD